MSLQDKNVIELKAFARERGLKRYSKLKKADLIQLLNVPASLLDEDVPQIGLPDPVQLVQAPFSKVLSTSTRQKIRIFWKIAITSLTLAQNPFNYSKRFNIILEINKGKLVHNYGNFNYKYMYFLKKCIFLRIFT